MNCADARQLVDERVHAGEGDAPDRWAALDAHLAKCPACAAELRELQQTCERVRELRGDKPTSEELNTMWQAVAQSLPASAAASLNIRLPWADIRRFAGAAAAVGVCLISAYFVGGELNPHREVSRRAAVPIASVATPALLPGPSPANPSGASHDKKLGVYNVNGLYSESSRDAGEPALQSLWMMVDKSDVTAVPRADFAFPLQGAAAGDAFFTAADGDGTQDARVDNGSEVALNWPQSGSNYLRITKSPDSTRESLGVPVDSVGRAFVPQLEPETARRLAQLGYVATAPSQSAADLRTPTLTTEDTAKIAAKNMGGGEISRFHARLLDGSSGLADTEGVTKAGAPVERVAASPQEQSARPQVAIERGEAVSAIPADAKIIKTGELRAEVEEFAVAGRQVEALVAQHGGFVADGGTKEEAGGSLAGTFVIRVGPAKFEALYAALRGIGRLEAENVKAADVTAQYVDLEARIKSLKIAEERLQELAKKEPKADKAGDQIKALLDIERELTNVRTQIEQHEGELRVMANRVAMSTINLSLHEPPRIVPSAQLGVEVGSLDEAVKALQQLVADFNARLSNGQIEKRDAGALAGHYQIVVNLKTFGDALDRLAALGRVDVRNVKDWHAPDASAAWGERVKCQIDLTLFERAAVLPSGTAVVEVADAAAALVELRNVLADAGAYVAGSQATQNADGSSGATVSIQAPAGTFAAVADKLAGVGRILQRNLTGAGEGIQGGAAQTPCTLTVTLKEPPRQIPSGRIDVVVGEFESARQKLVSLVQQQDVQVIAATSTQRTDGTWSGAFRLGIPAAKMDAVVVSLEGLGKVATRELTGLGLGELSRLHPQARGVLDLVLAEKPAVNPGGEQAGGTLRKHLREGLAGLYGSLGLILYGLVVMAPWVAIVLVVAWLIVRASKRRAARIAVAAKS